MNKINWVCRVCAAILIAFMIGMPSPAAAEKVLTLWSHWADHDSKRAFVEGAARAFEKATPGVTVKVSWYEKKALNAALKTAFMAGQGPATFYFQPQETEHSQKKTRSHLS